MSQTSRANLPVAAFCEPGRSIWGAFVGGPHPRLAVGRLGSPEPVASRPASARLAADAPAPLTSETAAARPADEWQLEADGVALTISGPEHGGGRELERCRLTGAVTLAGEQLTLEAPAIRCVPAPTIDAASLRLVVASFPAGHDVALLARRKRGAGGHDRDAILADVTGEADGHGVFDPRLSTTYGSDLMPRRMGIELWLGESEDGEHYPRRFAGQSASGAVLGSAGPVRWSATPLCCQTRGEEGVGVYVLLSTA